jgi:phosphohistidine phosphatase
MRQLVLMRHAHALPAGAGEADRERALSERGRGEACEAAQRLLGAHLHFQRVVVSPARRARETAALLEAQGALAVRPMFDPRLYPGAPEALLAALGDWDEAIHTALLVGHNPGLSELAQRAAAPGRAPELPTAGGCLLAIAGRTDWQTWAARPAARVSRL